MNPKYYEYHWTGKPGTTKIRIFDIGDTCYVLHTDYDINGRRHRDTQTRIHKATVIEQDWWLESNQHHPVYFGVKFGVKELDVHVNEIFETRAKAQAFRNSNDRGNREFWKTVYAKAGTINLINLRKWL